MDIDQIKPSSDVNIAVRKKRRNVVSAPRPKYESPLLESIHVTAMDLAKSGQVTKQTMRELDVLCLTPVAPMGPLEIKSLRDKEGVSQAVLARYINVSPNAVSQWERGEKRPSGVALKMLWIIFTKGLDAIR